MKYRGHKSGRRCVRESALIFQALIADKDFFKGLTTLPGIYILYKNRFQSIDKNQETEVNWSPNLVRDGQKAASRIITARCQQMRSQIIESLFYTDAYNVLRGASGPCRAPQGGPFAAARPVFDTVLIAPYSPLRYITATRHCLKQQAVNKSYTYSDMGCTRCVYARFLANSALFELPDSHFKVVLRGWKKNNICWSD